MGGRGGRSFPLHTDLLLMQLFPCKVKQGSNHKIKNNPALYVTLSEARPQIKDDKPVSIPRRAKVRVNITYSWIYNSPVGLFKEPVWIFFLCSLCCQQNQ